MRTLLIALAIYLPLLAATWASLEWGPHSLPDWGGGWLWPEAMTTSAKLAADLVLIELAYEAIDLEHIERLLAERRETR
jgi:hypothetical protein